MTASSRLSQDLASRVRDALAQFGYEVKDLPMMSRADLFLTKAGDEIVERLFTFEHRGHQIALRPEFTAGAVQLLVRSNPRPAVARWQFLGHVFENRHDLSLDTAHHLSIGAELFGLSGSMADAEAMMALATAVSQVGMFDWTLKIGHIGLLRSALQGFNLDPITERFLLLRLPSLRNPALGVSHVLSEFEQQLGASRLQEGTAVAGLSVSRSVYPHGNRSPTRSHEEIALRLSDKARRVEEQAQIKAAVQFLNQWCLIEGDRRSVTTEIHQLIRTTDGTILPLLLEWETTLDLLEISGLPVDRVFLQPALSRSWEYYSGIVFDVWIASHHVGGGGRYDDLARVLGAPADIPAVGFALDLDWIGEQIGPASNDAVSLKMVYPTMAQSKNAMWWAQSLRQAGHAIELIPASASPISDPDAVHVLENGSAQYRNTTYAMDQAAMLAVEIGANYGR